MEAAGSGIAFEASASGVDRGFSPVLHFCTDPRFGRCEESFGEGIVTLPARQWNVCCFLKPYLYIGFNFVLITIHKDPALVSTMGVAAVTGLSGKGSAGAANTYMAVPTTKIATEAKHVSTYTLCADH